MSVENVKKFYEDLSKDEKLKQKALNLQDDISSKLLKDASEDDLSFAAVDMAKKLGYNFSKEDLKEYASIRETSDDMLEEVSGGGTTCACVAVGASCFGGHGCGCFLLGGGGADCVCFIAGGSYSTRR